MTSVEPNLSWTCAACGNSFSRELSRAAHMVEAHDYLPCSERRCNRVFKTLTGLREHLKTAHTASRSYLKLVEEISCERGFNLRKKKNRDHGRREDLDNLGTCPYCGEPLDSRSASREHIMPRIRGGTLREGKRIVHAHCNTARALAGECVGALSCAFAVADTLLLPRRRIDRVNRVLKLWCLMGVRFSKRPSRAAQVAAMRAAHLGLPLPTVKILSNLSHVVSAYNAVRRKL